MQNLDYCFYLNKLVGAARSELATPWSSKTRRYQTAPSPDKSGFSLLLRFFQATNYQRSSSRRKPRWRKKPNHHEQFPALRRPSHMLQTGAILRVAFVNVAVPCSQSPAPRCVKIQSLTSLVTEPRRNSRKIAVAVSPSAKADRKPPWAIPRPLQ